MAKTEIMRRFVHQEVLKALQRSNLAYDHPMCEVLEQEAEIVGQPGCVRILDASDNWVMLENRIKELRADPRFRESVPNPAKIARGDESSLRANFDEIAKGTAVVE